MTLCGEYLLGCGSVCILPEEHGGPCWAEKGVPEPIDFGVRPCPERCYAIHLSGWMCSKLKGHKSAHRYVL